jgi:glycosyltransferase involved in cell wall biosynthesis
LSRIRLLAIISALDGGGAERQMLLLLKHLDRERFDLTLCLLAAEGPFFEHVPPGVPVVELGKQTRWDTPAVVARFARLVRRTRPDVILSKLVFTNEVAAAGNLLSLTRTPLVVVEEAVQSMELPMLTRPALRAALVRWAYRRATSVVAPSPGVAADLRDEVGVKARAFDVIPNMVELEEIQRAGEERREHPFSDSTLPLVVTMGRLVAPKGQADLLSAVALLGERHPCNLLVLGDGEDRARLEAMSEELGISDRVAFLGFLPNPFGVVAQADVFVSPSHTESFGNALIEAMALGVPVVSTRVPCGPEWIIADGSTGIFAEPREPADLARKIERVLKDSALRSGLATRGREAARAYDVEQVVGRYAELLERVAHR